MLIIQSFFSINFAYADDTIDNIVDATFTIEFKSGTDLKINIEIDAQKLTLPEKTYNSDEIKSADDEDIGSFRILLYQMLDRQLKETFSNADFINFSRPAFNGNTFNEELDIKLTSSYFGLNESVNSNEFINGLLDMDAWVNYSLNLKAEPGWNNTFLFNLGEKLDFETTNGILQGDYVKWVIKNWNGEDPDKLAKLRLFKLQPTTKMLKEDDIFFDLILDSKNVEPTSLTTNILVKSSDITVFDILPDFISHIEYMPADGIRLLVNNGFISWDDCYLKLIKPLKDRTASTIEHSSFNQTIDFTFYWDNTTTTECKPPYEISNMDSSPSLKAVLKDEKVNLEICDMTSRAFFGLINSGAESNITKEDVNFGDNLSDIGYNYSLTLYLPEKIYLNESNVYKWDENNPISGEFISDNVIYYEKEDKFTFIEIDIKSTELNLLSFFTGKTELTFGVDLSETRDYNVTSIPDEFVLPNKISIKYLNSDAFRLCVEEGVFNEKRITDFLNNEKDMFVLRLSEILKGLEINGNVNREVFDDSINSWDGNITNMDAKTPVKTSSNAHNSYSVLFDLNFLPPGVNIPIKTYNFSGIANEYVTYKMIFPKGISIDISDPSNKAIFGLTNDGREYLLITFDPSESNLSNNVEVTCKMLPSGLFVIGVFSPCILSFVIALILIVIIYILRKKRKGRKATSVPELDEEEMTGYEEEDYYVPPPPRKSK